MLIDIDNLPADDTPPWRVVDVSRGPACIQLDGVGRLLSISRQDTGKYPGLKVLTAHLGGIDDYGRPKFDGEPIRGDRSGLTKGSRGTVAFELQGPGVFEYWNWGEAAVRGYVAVGDDGRLASVSATQAAKILDNLACTESRGPASDSEKENE